MTLPKTLKQQIQSTESTEVNLKSLVAKVIVAALDAQEVTQKVERPKEDFSLVNSEIHTPSDQQVLGTRSKYSRINKRKDMLTLQSSAMTKLKIKQVMPDQTPLQPSELPFFVHSATL